MNESPRKSTGEYTLFAKRVDFSCKSIRQNKLQPTHVGCLTLMDSQVEMQKVDLLDIIPQILLGDKYLLSENIFI